jgi:hypothetical protein
MSQADWKTLGDLAEKVWTVLGPLVYSSIGVFIGSWLTKRHLKESRLAESKKEEYRELLSTLIRTLNTIANFHGPMSVIPGEEERKYYEAKDEALIAIDTRLFIRKDVDKMELRERWQNAVHELEQGGHSLAFVRAVRKITEDVKDTAEHLFD